MQVPFIALAGWHDVFHEILNHLEPADSDYDDLDHAEIRLDARRIFRSALLSLVLSCRALMDPSLDKLWHHLDSIDPLLRLLPNYQRRDYPYVSESVRFATCLISNKCFPWVAPDRRDLA